MLLILLQNLVGCITMYSIVYSFFQLVLVVNILKSLKMEISLIFFMKLTRTNRIRLQLHQIV
jgi:hypothetical protein